MDRALEAMLSRYHTRNNNERENAIKEIMQEIALAGLSRAKFFENAAFYGGSCLRIFHGLNRFSEDLDFALLNRNMDFNLNNYLPMLKKEFQSYGIDVNVEFKVKNLDRAVQSAFLKGNTLMLLMSFFPESSDAKGIICDQKIKIKIEIDTENPPGGQTEFRYRMLPAPYEIQIFDEPTLFSGKIHAVLCRDYRHRVKGRDYYDYLFYVGKGTAINLVYLSNKLKDSGKIGSEVELTSEMVKQMLRERFLSTDYELAKRDVMNFVPDQDSLSLWKSSLFLSTLDLLK